ncbi:MAG: hypothetical protein AVDCRST_MAG26-1078, partial [uncultured Chloroflexia bacterium]
CSRPRIPGGATSPAHCGSATHCP